MTTLLPGIVIILVVLAAITISAWAFQERIAFQPERPPFPTAGNTRQVEYNAADGQELFAYVVGDPSTAPGFLLAFHGNADLAVRQIDWAEEIARRTGFAIMIPEYRGYMGLGGRPAYEGSRLDAKAAYMFARDSLKVGEDRIAFFGHSLGSAIAVELAEQHRPAKLILEAPFTSARDMASLVAGTWFTSSIWPLVSRLHFNTIDLVSKLDVPVSVSHGGRDRIIPYRMGESVYRAAIVKERWLFVPDAGHSDMREIGGEGYWTWITAPLDNMRSGK